MLLAVEAARIAPTRQAEDALRQALLEFRQRVVVKGHNNDITPAVLSPDGALVVSAAGTMARVGS